MCKRLRAIGAAFLLLLPLGGPLSPAHAEGEQVTLNFKNADIRSIIEMVARATGKNFIIDPRVKGNVTIVSADPLGGEALYETFLSILQMHDYAAIPGKNLIKIVHNSQALQLAPAGPPGEEMGDDEMIFQVIKVRHVAAAQLEPILRPMLSKEGHLAAHQGANILILSATRGNIKRLTEIIRRVDRPEDIEVETITLLNASAPGVAQTLQSLINTKQKDALKPPVMIVADDRTNTLLVSGDPAQRARIRGMAARLDAPLENAGNTQVIYLRYAKAADLKPILEGVIDNRATVGKGGKKKQPAATSSRIGIVVDEQTNALIATATAGDMRAIRSIIERLDIRRAQVLVEALIVEISQDQARDLGVQWLAGPKFENSLGGQSGNLGALATRLGAGQFGTLVGTIAGERMDLAYVIRALSNDASANILSTPSLITLDNQEAEITVGSNVSFQTGSVTGDNNANPFNTYQRSDVGLRLKIKPQINEGNAVKLEIDQEISSLLPTAEGQSMTTRDTSRRAIKTSVIVEDSEILVLGGLMDDNLREAETRVPLLGSIPLLGELFKMHATRKEKRNLMIFIQPRILRDAATASAATNAKYNHIRALQLRNQAEGIDLLPESEAPLLPFNETPPASSTPASTQRSSSLSAPRTPLKGSIVVE